MIWVFTCNTKDCENQKHPVNLVNVTNPVLCSACYSFSEAVESDQKAPEATTEA
jgi:hypothetical protein